MRAALGIVGAVLVLAGCSSGAVAGDAEPVGKTAGEPVFSPCDDIPDDAVRAVGMDPATESRDILDVHQPGWNICGWTGDRYSLSLFSTVYTFDDLRNNGDYADFGSVRLGDRNALTFRNTAYPVTQRSYLAVESAEGMVMASVSDWDQDPSNLPPDQVVRETMQTLLPYLPK